MSPSYDFFIKKNMIFSNSTWRICI